MKSILKIAFVILTISMLTACAKKATCAGLAAHPDYKPTWNTR